MAFCSIFCLHWDVLRVECSTVVVVCFVYLDIVFVVVVLVVVVVYVFAVVVCGIVVVVFELAFLTSFFR